MSRALIAVAALALGACTTAPTNPNIDDKRSPEQINAASKDRAIEVTCELVPTPWGPVRKSYARQDKGAIVSGSIKTNLDCTLEVTSEPKQAKTVGAP